MSPEDLGTHKAYGRRDYENGENSSGGSEEAGGAFCGHCRVLLYYGRIIPDLLAGLIDKLRESQGGLIFVMWTVRACR